MRKISLLVVVAVLLVACGGGEEATTSTAEAVKIPIEDVFHEFMSCKDTTSDKLGCKTYPAKALCGVYEITDFVDPNVPTNYVEINEIINVINASGYWGLLGDADDQEVLDQAQQYANTGVAVIAVNTKKEHGNVAIILPGEQSPSGSWGGLNCPNSASFFMKGHKNSYIHKGLNYAWKKPKDIQIFARD